MACADAGASGFFGVWNLGQQLLWPHRLRLRCCAAKEDQGRRSQAKEGFKDRAAHSPSLKEALGSYLRMHLEVPVQIQATPHNSSTALVHAPPAALEAIAASTNFTPSAPSTSLGN